MHRNQMYSLTAAWALAAAVLSGCHYSSGQIALLRNLLPSAPPAPRATSAMQLAQQSDSLPMALSNPQKADIQFAMGQSQERQGKLDAAIDAYQRVRSLDPKRADAAHRLAVLNDRKGNHAEALRLYQKSLELTPDQAEVYADMGYSHYLQQRWEEAAHHLQRAIAIVSNLKRAHNNLGLALARTGQYDTALVAFAHAGCNEAQGRANLAHVLMLDQQWPAAQVQCELALATEAASPDLRQRLEEFHRVSLKAQQPAGMAQQPAGDAPSGVIQQVSSTEAVRRTPELPVATPAASQIPSVDNPLRP